MPLDEMIAITRDPESREVTKKPTRMKTVSGPMILLKGRLWTNSKSELAKLDSMTPYKCPLSFAAILWAAWPKLTVQKEQKPAGRSRVPTTYSRRRRKSHDKAISSRRAKAKRSQTPESSL